MTAEVELMESALIVPVPAAEPVVGRWRNAYDPAANWGIPAHVTILYPFMPPDRIDDAVLTRVAAVIGSVTAFEFALDSVSRFGTAVLYLEPKPADRFTALIAATAAEWPDYPPYEGAHDEVIPHLTIAHTGRGASFEAIASRVRDQLPIRTRAESVSLLTGSPLPGSWKTVTTFSLGR